MAHLIRSSPENRGEGRLFQFLTDNLPERWFIVGNHHLTLNGRVAGEIDAVVIGPDYIWAVETKDWSGKVTGDKSNWTQYPPGKDPRREESPIEVISKKARKLKGEINLSRVWIEELVVVTGSADLSGIDDPRKDNYVKTLEQCRAYFANPGVTRSPAQLSPREQFDVISKLVGQETAKREFERLELEIPREAAPPYSTGGIGNQEAPRATPMPDANEFAANRRAGTMPDNWHRPPPTDSDGSGWIGQALVIPALLLIVGVVLYQLLVPSSPGTRMPEPTSARPSLPATRAPAPTPPRERPPVVPVPAPPENVGAFSSLNAQVASLRFFESGGDLLPRGQRAYGDRFQKSNSRFISWELDLNHQPPGRRVEFPIVAEYFRRDGRLISTSTYRSWVEGNWPTSWHSSRSGWPTAGQWLAGSYKVVLSVDGSQVAVAWFEIIDDQHVSAQRDHQLQADAERAYLEEKNRELDAKIQALERGGVNR